MVTFGRKLKACMDLNGIDVAQLADALCVSYQTIVNWRSDHSKPQPYNMNALCSALGVGPEVFEDE